MSQIAEGIGQTLTKWQERVTESPKFIDTDHAYVHEGIAYDAFWTGGITSTVHFQFSTPAAKYVHFRPAGVGIDGGVATFRIFAVTPETSSPTPVSGGSTFTPVNRKHTSTSASEVTFNTEIDTSSTASYVLKYQTAVYGGSGPGGSRTGQSKGEPLEWIFTPGRTYVFTLTQGATEITAATLNLFWYEEANA